MHYLIVGHKGMLGSCLCRALSEAGRQVTGTDIDEFDITRPEDTRREIEKIRPDLIVNCAAYTDVDGSETHPDTAHAVNATGPENLAAAASRIGVKLIHISTDFVFDGKKGSAYKETDPTAPLSVYGASKLAGERALAAKTDHYMIIRTSWLYGPGGRNFVKTILQLAVQKDVLDVVDDQRGSPTYVLDLAQAIRDLSQLEYTGTVHFSNAGDCTWCEFASRIVTLAGRKTAVRPTTTDRFPRPAKRPPYSVLDLSTVTRLLGYAPRPWEEALKTFIQDYYPSA